MTTALRLSGTRMRGNAAKCLETLDACVNKVLRTLRRHAYHKAVVARGEACHKGLHLYNLARITVHIAHGVSRKVEENLFAAYIQVFENGRRTVVLLGRDVLAVVVAELREAVAAGVVSAVLFPQQLQRHMLAPHLALKIRQHLLELLETGVGVRCVASLHPVLKHRILQGKQLVKA